MLRDDLVGDRQAQSRSLAHVLGREERIEDARQHFGRHAAAVVLDLDRHVIEPLAPGDHHDPAAGPDHRLDGIGDEVEQHLVHLRGRAGDGGDLVEALLDVDPAQERARDEQRGAHAVVHVVARHLAAVQPREVAQVGDELRDLLDAVQSVLGERVEVVEHLVLGQLGEARRKSREGGLQVVGAGRFGLQHGEQPLGLREGFAKLRHAVANARHAVLHVGERRVDLVHYPRDQLPERRHLLGLHELGFGFLQSRHGARELGSALGHAALELLVRLAQRALGRDDARAEVSHADQQCRRIGREIDAPAVLLVERGLDRLGDRARRELEPSPEGEEREAPPRGDFRAACVDEAARSRFELRGGSGQRGIGRGGRGRERSDAWRDGGEDRGMVLDARAAKAGAHVLDFAQERGGTLGRGRAAGFGGAHADHGEFRLAGEFRQGLHGGAVRRDERAESRGLLGEPGAQSRHAVCDRPVHAVLLEVTQDAREQGRAVGDRCAARGGGSELAREPQRVGVPAGVEVLHLAQQRERVGFGLEVHRLGAHEKEDQQAQQRGSAKGQHHGSRCPAVRHSCPGPWKAEAIARHSELSARDRTPTVTIFTRRVANVRPILRGRPRGCGDCRAAPGLLLPGRRFPPPARSRDGSPPGRAAHSARRAAG